MANIVDLLGDGTQITKRNPSMSRLYMFYQLFNLASSVLAPSTVVLMIAGQADLNLLRHSLKYLNVTPVNNSGL